MATEKTEAEILRERAHMVISSPLLMELHDSLEAMSKETIVQRIEKIRSTNYFLPPLPESVGSRLFNKINPDS